MIGVKERRNNDKPLEMTTASTSLLKNRQNFNSRLSVGRYSERSLHSLYTLDGYKPSSTCDDCMTRVPYATLMATIMCITGVGIFCGTMYRGATLSTLMLDEVFHLRLTWLEPVQMVFVIIAASMAALGLMILFVGCLATGATRHKVYRAWRARVSGRISCAVFMCITYILQIAWLMMFVFLVIVTLCYTIFWQLCSAPRVQNDQRCIDFTQFDFIFPAGTRVEDMMVCEPHERKLFCKDYVEKAEIMFILATTAAFLIILSLLAGGLRH
ncbi:neuronal membrane glycoprotein M6 isoform X2 [Lycorma delicatula]|uniref:neuronal membrane glycoprotein M6 isoform X2 n=1 Tax=Lycorma delicatula TaxID=130591 RepID=UPI003F50EEBA